MADRILGVLLAAGTGSRFEGDNKLLADLCGKPVVARAARPLAAARRAGDLDGLVAVLGHEADRVEDALAGLPFEIVENPAYAAGQATSVARGARAARDRNVDAAVFALGDLPCVSSETVEILVRTWRDADGGIVVPTHGGQRGNPVLFDSRHFDDLVEISGDTGGREIFADNPVERVAVDDPGIHRDVDTVEDLESLPDGCR